MMQNQYSNNFVAKTEVNYLKSKGNIEKMPIRSSQDRTFIMQVSLNKLK